MTQPRTFSALASQELAYWRSEHNDSGRQVVHDFLAIVQM